jgi:endonuclease I
MSQFTPRTAVARLVLVLLMLPAAAALADAPAGYYDSVDLTNQDAMRATLHNVIDGHTKIPYTSSSTDTWNVLELADEDPLNSNNILDVYRNRSIVKYGAGNNYYNREHTWPNSYGFPDDNSGNLPYSDCHHLFLCDISYNSYRGSLVYDNCTSGCTARPTDNYNGVSGVNYYYSASPVGGWETWQHRRGDVARAMFYMDVRYEGDAGSEPDLIVTDDLNAIVGCQTGNNEAVGYMGKLTTLLQWHLDDPVDDRERNRNDVIHQYQGNRNPFIDHPEWVDMLFGEGIVAAPDAPAAVAHLVGAHPNPFNPSTRVVFTMAEAGDVQLEVYGLDGKRVDVLMDGMAPAGENAVRWDGRDSTGRSLPSGSYLVRLKAGGSLDSERILLLK